MLDLLLPRRCLLCRSGGALLCAACSASLHRIVPPLCARCGAPTAWPVERCRECAGRRLPFASARAAIVYDDAARRIVHAWKERGLRTLAVLAAGLVVESIPRPDSGVLTFVPSDAERSLSRGHRPPQRLAGELAARWRLPVTPLLERTRPFRPQRGLSLSERRRNVRGAFRARGRPPARVVLVDDVYTTGATVADAASALRRAGARRVEVVSFARVVR